MRTADREASVLTASKATRSHVPGALDAGLEDWIVENFAARGEPLGAGYQAEVRRLELPSGAAIAVKRPRRGLIGALARRAIRREHAAYRRLAGIPGIPRPIGLTRAGWLAVEFVEGRSLRAAQHEIADRERFFACLLATIRAMHAAGVAHGDLKRKDNVMVTADGRPMLIDFGISRIRGATALGGLVFDLVRQLDLNSWVKLKHGGRPVTLPPADAEVYRPLLVENVARWMRVPWQKLTFRRPRQRLRRWLESRARRP